MCTAIAGELCLVKAPVRRAASEVPDGLSSSRPLPFPATGTGPVQVFSAKDKTRFGPSTTPLPWNVSGCKIQIRCPKEDQAAFSPAPESQDRLSVCACRWNLMQDIPELRSYSPTLQPVKNLKDRFKRRWRKGIGNLQPVSLVYHQTQCRAACK